MVDLDDDANIDYAPFPDNETKKGGLKNDFAPKNEKGDDEGSDDGHSAHSFDEDDKFDQDEDHVKKFEPLKVKVGISWENVSIGT